jgi:hypothetical protein
VSDHSGYLVGKISFTAPDWTFRFVHALRPHPNYAPAGVAVAALLKKLPAWCGCLWLWPFAAGLRQVISLNTTWIGKIPEFVFASAMISISTE